jgi:DNA polymerase
MAEGRTGSHGPINWEANTIWLPNGMALKYPDLKKAMGDKGWEEWTYQSGKQRKKIYGGLLCENIVQALARIIVGWQMLQISRKYRVVMTTHDEVVAIAKKAQAEACIKYMAKWMSTAPAWCSDIPLNSEGGFDVNYSK